MNLLCKGKLLQKQIPECGGDQIKFFDIVNFLLSREKQIVHHQHADPLTFASLCSTYFITKIADIRKEFPDLEADAAQSFSDFNL